MSDPLHPALQARRTASTRPWGTRSTPAPGWFDLLTRLDARLVEITPGYVIEQCKIKFGALRFYAGRR